MPKLPPYDRLPIAQLSPLRLPALSRRSLQASASPACGAKRSWSPSHLYRQSSAVRWRVPFELKGLNLCQLASTSTMECFQSSRSLRLLASPSSTAATSTFWAPLWTGAVPVAPAPGVLVVDACTGGALAPTMVAPEAEASLAPACPNTFDTMFPKTLMTRPQVK